MNLLQRDNTLHKTALRYQRRDDLVQESESDSEFSSWAKDSPSTSEAEIVEIPTREGRAKSPDADKRSPKNRTTRAGRTSRRSSLDDAVELSAGSHNGLRSVSPVRRSSPGPAVSRAATSERPSFQRRLTARSSTPGPSLLTTSLQHYASPADMAHSLPARPDVSSTASSDNELSDFDLSAMASKRSTPIATSPHQPNEHIRQESSVSQSSTIPLPKRKRGVRQISGPFSPSNSAGNSSALSARRRSGIESEPEDGKLAANSSFLELLQATKPFLSLASGAANFPTKAVPDATAPTPKDSPIVPASALHHASPDHEQAPSSPSLYEKDIPTSFAASATSATSTDSPPNEDKPKNGLFEWLSGLLHVKVWQAVVVCSAVFATGYSIAHFAPRLRL